jgi:hypothetical protein
MRRLVMCVALFVVCLGCALGCGSKSDSVPTTKAPRQRMVKPETIPDKAP